MVSLTKAPLVQIARACCSNLFFFSFLLLISVARGGDENVPSFTSLPDHAVFLSLLRTWFSFLSTFFSVCSLPRPKVYYACLSQWFFSPCCCDCFSFLFFSFLFPPPSPPTTPSKKETRIACFSLIREKAGAEVWRLFYSYLFLIITYSFNFVLRCSSRLFSFVLHLE